MRTLAEVRLWGRTIGAVVLESDETAASFEYEDRFSGSGIEVSPFEMPLSHRIYRFPELSRQSFRGLPGLLADSLPDRFGNALIDSWLARQGRPPTSFNAVERLCYTGSRGMGALEYRPITGPTASEPETVHVEDLVTLANDVLGGHNAFQTQPGDPSGALSQLFRVGTSAGGARAKAVLSWNNKTGEFKSGQVPLEEGFSEWLLKFDGITANRDRELTDPQGYSAIEFAYYGMALASGISMSESRLFEEGDRRHFMTRRFDRTDSGGKIHMQSLGALRHYDYNLAGAYSYESALQTIRMLMLPMKDLEELFRRMVFNVVTRNQDDHVKNIAFLMDKQGVWSLSPAFDLAYSFNPSGDWTARHQMTINGKRESITRSDVEAIAQTFSMKHGRSDEIVDHITEVASRWRDFARDVSVSDEWITLIGQNLRLNL